MLIEVTSSSPARAVEIPADLVVLMVGMEARETRTRWPDLVNISQDKDGWFIESHPKLDPVATTTDGIFIAGACAGAQGHPRHGGAGPRRRGRASWPRSPRARSRSTASSPRCTRSCARAAGSATSSARTAPSSSTTTSAAATSSPRLCKACGACVAACPSGAIKARHFTDEQIFAQIEGVLP